MRDVQRSVEADTSAKRHWVHLVKDLIVVIISQM